MTEHAPIAPPSALHAAAWCLTTYLDEQEALSLTVALARLVETRLVAPEQALVFDALVQANRLRPATRMAPRRATKRGKR